MNPENIILNEQASLKGTHVAHVVGVQLGEVSGVAKLIEGIKNNSGSFHNVERVGSEYLVGGDSISV